VKPRDAIRARGVAAFPLGRVRRGGMVDRLRRGDDDSGLGRMGMVSDEHPVGGTPLRLMGRGFPAFHAIPHEKSGTRRSRFQH